MIEDDSITEVGAAIAVDGHEVIDATDKVAIPVLVNRHMHSFCKGSRLPLDGVISQTA